MQYANVTLTEIGAQKVREFLSSQGADTASAGLRLGVRGGGCSGFQYQLAFDEQRREPPAAGQTAETSSSSGTRNEEPQPQAAMTFGLFTWKPAPVRAST